jgi:hypothetical protein
MANYPVNPEPFLPPDFEIEHGGQNRVVRAVVNLSGEPIYAHEQFTIAVDVDGVLHPSDNQRLLAADQTLPHQRAQLACCFHLPSPPWSWVDQARVPQAS